MNEAGLAGGWRHSPHGVPVVHGTPETQPSPSSAMSSYNCSNLGRIHVLPLGDEAIGHLYPTATSRLSKQKETNCERLSNNNNFPPPASTSSVRPEIERDVLPIVNLLSQLLETAIQRNCLCILQLFQSFFVDNKCYVVVDMETANHSRCSSGILTGQTSIFTSGGPIESLKSLRLYLQRPFSREVIDPSCDICSPDMTGGETSPMSVPPSTDSPSFSFRRIARRVMSRLPSGRRSSLNTSSEPLTDTEISNDSNPPSTSCLTTCGKDNTTIDKKARSESSSFFGSRQQPPTDEKTVAVSLSRIVQRSIDSNPSIVFIKGREVHLSCPPELLPLPRNPWSSEWRIQRQQSQQQQQSRVWHNARDRSISTITTTAGSSSYDPNLSTSSEQQQQQQPEASSPGSICRHSSSLLRFVVANTGGIPLGVLVPGLTDVEISLDPVGEFERIQVSPILDTIPRSYEFDFFGSYLRPFIECSPLRLFHKGELLAYHAVQFRVQRTLPLSSANVAIPDNNLIYWVPFCGKLTKNSSESSNNQQSTDDIPIVCPISHLPGALEMWREDVQTFKRNLISSRGTLCCRIGQLTRIHQGRPVNLHWLDFLPQDDVEEIRLLPTRLQPFALIHAIGALSQYDVIRIMGWSMDDENVSDEAARTEEILKERMAISIVKEYSIPFIPPTSEDTLSSSQVCIVCLESLEVGIMVLELPCHHIFHGKCVEEWLKRSMQCPVCKRDLTQLFRSRDKTSN